MRQRRLSTLSSIRRSFGYSMIAPATIVLFVMTIYPFIYVIVVSLHRWAIVPSIPRIFVGLNNFLQMYRDTDVHKTLFVTFVFTFGVVLIELLLGFLLALLLASTRQRWLRVVLLLPTVIAPVVVGLTWKTLLSYDLGQINYFLKTAGLNPVNWLGREANALTSVMLVDVWQWTPFSLLIFLAGLESLPVEPYEAARVDGASYIQLVRFITLPQLTPIIAIVLLFRTLDAFKTFDTIYMITGGGPGNATDVLSFRIYQKAFFQNQLGYAAALSVLTLILATLMMSIFSRILRRTRQSV
jgi:multiple sugar transport system permease protein